MAALVTVSATKVWAISDSDAQKLQDENAALRKRLAELEGKVSAQPATTTTTTTTTATTPAASGATLSTDAGVDTLSPFVASTDKDTGYLRTNSVTATRINMPIQNIPISVSVMSKDFIDDNNIRSITDVLKFTSSGAGDNNFAMRVPANSATAQGQFTLRGFPVNTILRNGISRYIGYNVNNVDRIEVVKGPASVFFGAGYPGGVINYITKQPVFAKIPTTISYTFGDNNTNRVVVDNNTQLSKKAAMRLVGSWENDSGARNFEYNKTNTLDATLAITPFDSGKLKLTFEVETYQSKLNQNQGDWVYPTGWFNSYTTPQQNLIAVAQGTPDAGGNPLNDYANALGGRTAIKNPAGTIVGYTPNVSNAATFQNWIFAAGGQANWINAVRTAANDFSIPLYTQDTRGAYYTAANGSRVHDESFNYTSRGAYVNNNVETPSFTVEFSPFTWLDARYVFTKESARFDDIGGTIAPNADGRTFNTQGGLTTGTGYYMTDSSHQIDLIFKLDGWGIKNRLLVGGSFKKLLTQYNGVAPGTPNYSQVPGATNPLGNPGVVVSSSGVATGGSLVPVAYTADVPVNQVIRDRFGNIKTVQQVYTQYDPGTEIDPDVSKTVLYNRTLLDGYLQEYQAGYINYNGSLLDDRLNILAGVRREMNRDSGQYLTANYPWYSPPPYAFADTVTYDPGMYNYGPSYSGNYSNFTRQAGTSWMAGLSYALTKEINIFTSYSKTFRLNTGNAGGIGLLDVDNIYGAAMAYAATPAGGSKNSFVYNGQTITSKDQFTSVLSQEGALTKIPNEKGFNAELGVKTSLWDNKLVGTLSVFRMERQNQKIDDSGRQGTEQLNYTNNASIFGSAGTTYNGVTYGPTSGTTRVLRWYTVGVRNRIEGSDMDLTWTPTRNFQTVIGGSWLWTAATLDSPANPKPGSAAYNALAPSVAKVNDYLLFNERIENVPEYQLKSTSKYTFTDGTFAGLGLMVSERYESKTNISRTADYNPENGGLTAGNFITFDLGISYPWEVMGYKISSSFNVYNVFDTDYIEGNTTVLSQPRTWLISNTLKF